MDRLDPCLHSENHRPRVGLQGTVPLVQRPCGTAVSPAWHLWAASPEVGLIQNPWSHHLGSVNHLNLSPLTRDRTPSPKEAEALPQTLSKGLF